MGNCSPLLRIPGRPDLRSVPAMSGCLYGLRTRGPQSMLSPRKLHATLPWEGTRLLLLYFHIGQCWTICQYANLKLGAIQTLSHHGFRLTSLLSDVEMPLWEDTECRMSSCQGTMPVWIISFHSMILLLGSLRSCLHWFGLSLIFGMINYAILDCQCLVQWHCPEAGV